MNYTFLSQGDHLPTVGVLQKLLNREGAKLTPDGIFGTFRFEGPTFTALPNGQSLKEWCKALPELPTMSFASP